MRRASIAAAAGLLISASSSYTEEAPSAGHREAGAIVFKKCMACHQVGEGARNGIGPVLNGVVGRPVGNYPGYSYSTATKNAGLVWDEPTLARYLRAPRSLIPGTRMAFPGLTKDQEIMDVIAYLQQFGTEGKQALTAPLIGTLLARWIGDHHAHYLQEQMDHGGLLLWVRTRDAEKEKSATEILKKHSSRDVHLHASPAAA